jgi:hypothetical protein
VDRQNRSCARCQGRRDARRIEIVGLRIGFDRYGCCSRIRDGQPGCNVRVGRNDHFCAGTNIHGAQNEIQRIQAVTDTDAVFGAAIGREVCFKGLGFFAQNAQPDSITR